MSRLKDAVPIVVKLTADGLLGFPGVHVAERVVEELNEDRELVQILRRVMEVHRVLEEALKLEGVIQMVAQVV